MLKLRFYSGIPKNLSGGTPASIFMFGVREYKKIIDALEKWNLKIFWRTCNRNAFLIKICAFKVLIPSLDVTY
jgi:hypothetical protein